MPNASIADWILSLVAPPDRAASPRGPLWFFSSVLRTACSHMWRDLSASPFKMLRLALWGWLANAVLMAMLLAAYVVVLGLSAPWVPKDVILWSQPVFAATCFTVAPFMAGSMVARRSKGRELAAGAIHVRRRSLTLRGTPAR